jgi:hypothetical protein
MRRFLLGFAVSVWRGGWVNAKLLLKWNLMFVGCYFRFYTLAPLITSYLLVFPHNRNVGFGHPYPHLEYDVRQLFRSRHNFFFSFFLF